MLIQDKTVVIMNYSSRVGFSGGPLVSKESGKVVGLMSFMIHREVDSSASVVAIRMADIEPFAARLVQRDKPKDKDRNGKTR
jgi:S1-C subfamily serine protease